MAIAFLVPLVLVVQQLARDRAMADAERETAVVVAVLAVTTDPAAVDRAISATGEPVNGSRVAVHNLAGGGIGERHAKLQDINRVAAKRQRAEVQVPDGLSYLEPVDVGGGRTAVVEVFIRGDELNRGVQGAWYALTGVALGLVAASVLIGDRLAAKVVRSARELAVATTGLGDGNLGVRVKPSGPRELTEAGLAFNAMADRVSVLLANEREMVADLSHRLRTPLTALRLDAETLDDGWAGERIRHAIDLLEGEVDRIIRTARKQTAAGEGEEQVRCDANEVVRDRMEFWSQVAADQGRWCQVAGPDQPAPVPVAKADLSAALDAMLGNVFRYTPQGAPFEAAVSRRDGYVTIRVEDGGPGIDDPDRALRRGMTDHGSTGLGLDIVRRVAIAAGGTVDIDRGRFGGASIVVLMADADPRPRPAVPSGSRFPFVGRLSRDPGERRPRDESRRDAMAAGLVDLVGRGRGSRRRRG